MLWEHGVAGSSPAIPIYPCDGTGIRAGIRVQILQVPNWQLEKFRPVSTKYGVIAQMDRAPALQAGGYGFKSH